MSSSPERQVKVRPMRSFPWHERKSPVPPIQGKNYDLEGGSIEKRSPARQEKKPLKDSRLTQLRDDSNHASMRLPPSFRRVQSSSELEVVTPTRFEPPTIAAEVQVQTNKPYVGDRPNQHQRQISPRSASRHIKASEHQLTSPLPEYRDDVTLDGRSRAQSAHVSKQDKRSDGGFLDDMENMSDVNNRATDTNNRSPNGRSIRVSRARHSISLSSSSEYHHIANSEGNPPYRIGSTGRSYSQIDLPKISSEVGSPVIGNYNPVRNRVIGHRTVMNRRRTENLPRLQPHSPRIQTHRRGQKSGGVYYTSPSEVQSGYSNNSRGFRVIDHDGTQSFEIFSPGSAINRDEWSSEVTRQSPGRVLQSPGGVTYTSSQRSSRSPLQRSHSNLTHYEFRESEYNKVQSPSSFSHSTSSNQSSHRFRHSPVSPHGSEVSYSSFVGPDPETIVWSRGETLGTGSFGTVYVALDMHTGKRFAVKKIDIQSASEEHKRSFRQEIDVMKRLRHKHIVGYLWNHLPNPDTMEIFLEFVAGGSVSKIIQLHGPILKRFARTITEHMLLGIQYLHNNNIIHRDIKGGNVLVTDDGVAKLADFGCSKQLKDIKKEDQTFKRLCGSVPWMSPEMARQEGHNRPTDIWSLGCTLIEMITGQNPWPHIKEQYMAIISIAQTKTHPPYPDNLSEDIRDFLDRCFPLDPEERETADQLLNTRFVTGYWDEEED